MNEFKKIIDNLNIRDLFNKKLPDLNPNSVLELTPIVNSVLELTPIINSDSNNIEVNNNFVIDNIDQFLFIDNYDSIELCFHDVLFIKDDIKIFQLLNKSYIIMVNGNLIDKFNSDKYYDIGNCYIFIESILIDNVVKFDNVVRIFETENKKYNIINFISNKINEIKIINDLISFVFYNDIKNDYLYYNYKTLKKININENIIMSQLHYSNYLYIIQSSMIIKILHIENSNDDTNDIKEKTLINLSDINAVSIKSIKSTNNSILINYKKQNEKEYSLIINLNIH